MNITIDPFDYISPEKLTQIVEEEIRLAIRSQIKKTSIESALTNLTGEYVFKLMETEWAANGVDFEKALKEAINNAIKVDDVRYYVFRRQDVWNRTESPAVKIMDEECANSRPLIREMVEKHIREYPFEELERDEIGSVIYEVIMDKILGDKK